MTYTLSENRISRFVQVCEGGASVDDCCEVDLGGIFPHDYICHGHIIAGTAEKNKKLIIRLGFISMHVLQKPFRMLTVMIQR